MYFVLFVLFKTYLSKQSKIRIEHLGLAVALVVEEILPLLHHSQEIIIQQQHFHSDVVLHRRDLTPSLARQLKTSK